MKYGKMILLLLALLCLFGCAQEAATEPQGELQGYSRNQAECAISGNKTVFIKDSLIYIDDITKNTPTVFCTNPECEHAPYDYDTNPEPECEAAENGDMGFLAVGICGKTVYEYGSSKESDETVVYSRTLGSSGWKKLGTIPYTVASGSDMYYIDNKVYFCGTKTLQYGQGEEMDECEAAVLKMDLKSAEVQKLSQAYTSKGFVEIQNFCYDDGCFYYGVNTLKEGSSMEEFSMNPGEDTMDVKVYCVSMDTGKEERLAMRDWKAWEYYGCNAGNLYYCNEKDQVMEYNLKTEKEKKIFTLTGRKECNFYSGVGMIQVEDYDKMSFFDFSKGELTEVKTSEEDAGDSEENQTVPVPDVMYQGYCRMNRLVSNNGEWIPEIHWISTREYLAGNR